MVLFINSAFRGNSRTLEIARNYLSNINDKVEEIDLGSLEVHPLDRELLIKYNQSVEKRDFSDPMFDIAKKFASADSIIIAAPFYNYSIPAKLHDYLEMVCSQGLTFDITPEGNYISLCKAKKLTFITTAGGPIPEKDHAYSYIKDLCDVFWRIKDVEYIKKEGLDE